MRTKALTAAEQFFKEYGHADTSHRPCGYDAETGSTIHQEPAAGARQSIANARHSIAGGEYSGSVGTNCGWWWCLERSRVPEGQWAELTAALRTLRGLRIDPDGQQAGAIAVLYDDGKKWAAARADYDAIVTALEKTRGDLLSESGRLIVDELLTRALHLQKNAHTMNPKGTKRDVVLRSALARARANRWEDSALAPLLLLYGVERQSLGTLKRAVAGIARDDVKIELPMDWERDSDRQN